MKYNDMIYTLSFSPDSRYSAMASGDMLGNAREQSGHGSRVLVELPRGREIANFKHRDRAFALMFSEDGQWLATGSRDGTAQIIEVASGREVATINFGRGVLY